MPEAAAPVQAWLPSLCPCHSIGAQHVSLDVGFVEDRWLAVGAGKVSTNSFNKLLFCLISQCAFLFFFLIFYFIYLFWLRWVFVAACGLSLVVASGGYSSLQCAGFSLQWLLLLRNTGSRCAGFSSCGSRA